MPGHTDTLRRSLTCVLLAAATVAVYWGVHRFEFTNYDDWEVALKNPVVHQGLTAQSVAWAFTTHFYDYWHPLAWLSHMLDVQLFGLNAGLHHVTSLVIHVLNVWLVFLVFGRLTGAWERSAFLAALFALHPLNVDSVAWIAERKNVLSTTFWLLTLWAYARYAARPAAGRYLLTLGLFALGLMAKPMLVTLPFVLLLLDYWPLRRLELPFLRRIEASNADAWSVGNPLPRLLLEKLPFLLLALASTAITYGTASAKGFVASTEKFPMVIRLLNVPVAYVAYLWKLIWPVDLAVFYPHPGLWPLWKIAGASAILLGLSLAVFAQYRRHPYLFVGWLWFLGTLVPVIGIIQTGGQFIADRWAYVPQLGFFLALVWAASDLASGSSARRRWLRWTGGLALAGCAALSTFQVRHWQNTVTLFRHALTVTTNNHVAHYNLGLALMEQGQVEEPLRHFSEAVRIRPEYEDAHNNLGLALASLGRWQEATNHLIRACLANPAYSKAHHNLGSAFFTLGNLREATNQFRQALSLNPTNADTWYNLGVALANMGHPDQAASSYAQALRLAPRDAATHHWMGKALAAQGQRTEAIGHFSEALHLQADYQDAHFSLGVELSGQGEFNGAFTHLSEAVRLNPDHAEARSKLAIVLNLLGRPTEAIAQYREALRRKPDLVEALNNLAWMQATHPNAALRNGREAVELAGRACAATDRKQPVLLGTLAAAFAEAGEFERAVATATEARNLAGTLGQEDVAARNQVMLDLYRQGKPCRDSP